MENQAFHIFIKQGDAVGEVDDVRVRLAAGGVVDSGFHKSIYVTRADQTVVFLTTPDSPLGRALRGRGWQEPDRGGSPTPGR